MSAFGERKHLLRFGGGIVIVIVLIIFCIILMLSRKKEHLTNTVMAPSSQSSQPSQPIVPKESSHATEYKQEDTYVKPQIFDAGSGTIMSGPEFIPSQYLSPWYQAYTGNLKNYYLLDDGAGGSAGLQFNMCSKACCSEQYPLPFKMPVDSAVCANKDNFVPNNYMCNNAWEDSGCVCMTKEQADLIGSRGGNA